MLVGDLIYNDDFDMNCNFAVYEIKPLEGITWHNTEPTFSTRRDGFHKPPCALLDKKVIYITFDYDTCNLVIECE